MPGLFLGSLGGIRPRLLHAIYGLGANVARQRQYAKLTSDEIMVLAFLRNRLDTLKVAD